MGSAQSDLRAPIRDGDAAAVAAVLDSYGDASGLLVRKQFNLYDGEMWAVQPYYVTPARYAIMQGHADVLRVLLERGADPDEGTTLHWSEPGYGSPGTITLLHHAAKKHDAACTAVLLEHNADVLARDAARQTPLHHLAAGASSKRQQPAVAAAELLLQTAAAVEAVHSRDAGGRTALHYAALGGCVQLIELLLACGADPLAADNGGTTPTALAARHPAVQHLLAVAIERSATLQHGEAVAGTVAESQRQQQADTSHAAPVSSTAVAASDCR